MASRQQFFDSLFDRKAMRRMYPHHDSALRAYLRDIGTLSQLTGQQETHLLLQALQGDSMARRRLIEGNLRLVITIAARFQGRGLSMIDLIAEGNLGLLNAIKDFDFARARRLSTYAKYRIVQAIGRAVVERGKLIHTPYSTGQRIQKIGYSIAELLEQGIEPTAKKIADRAGLSVEQVTELLDLVQEPLSFHRMEGEHDPLAATLAAPPLLLSNEVATPSLFADVTAMIGTVLTEDERQVIEHLYGLGEQGIVYDHHEIAARCYDRTGPRVDVRIRQIEQSALRKLRVAFGKA